MTHISDEQLVEFHYLGATPDASMHLEACASCADRQKAISRDLESAAASGMESAESRPDSFWARQQLAVQRRIAGNGRISPSAARPWMRWVATAAAVVLLVTAIASVPRIIPPEREAFVNAAATPAPSPATAPLDVIEEIGSLEDPWESEELKPFGAAVEWETWGTENQSRNNS